MTHLFYGDIFRIEDIGCLFFGHGKTQAGRTAINGDDDKLISLDMARIDRVDNIMYGSCDLLLSMMQQPGGDILLKSSPVFNFEIIDKYIKGVSPIPDKNTKIELLIRCLNEEETKDIYGNLDVYIKEVDYYIFVTLSHFNITFMNTLDAVEIFNSLFENSNVKRCLIVPWMNTHDEKGELIKNYINNYK